MVVPKFHSKRQEGFFRKPDSLKNWKIELEMLTDNQSIGFLDWSSFFLSQNCSFKNIASHFECFIKTLTFIFIYEHHNIFTLFIYISLAMLILP